MPRYSDERKEAVLRKMLPPHNRPLTELAAEEGISEATLYNWRREAREQGRLLPDGATGPAGWSAADKFAAVVETAALNETELGAYCRQRGLYPEQVQAWRSACEHANEVVDLFYAISHCHGWVCNSAEAVTVRLEPLQQSQRRAAQEQFCRKLTALGAQTPQGKRLVVEVGEPPL